MNTPEEYEHYRRIRTDPLYRLELRIQDLENERMPPLSFEPRQPEPEPLKIVKNINWDDWQQVLGDLRNLRNKVVELMAVKKEEESFY